MNLKLDPQLVWLFGGLLLLLVVATIVGWLLRFRARSEEARATIANLNTRVRAWWGMSAIFGGTLIV